MITRIPAFAFVLTLAIPLRSAEAVAPGAREPEVEIVLPRVPDRSPPAQFLAGVASSRLIPGATVREARRGESARLFARFRFQDLRLLPMAKRILDAAGVGEVTLQVFPDGDLVRMVASVRVDPRVPPPFANSPRAAPPAMREGDWATAAVRFDAERVVPWAVDVARRVDEFQGQILKDALVVAKWNLGLDVEGDIAGSFAGGVRALAARGSEDSAALVADLRAAAPLAKALTALSLASRLVRGRGVGLGPARFGEVGGYRIRTPWAALAPALVLGDGALVASTDPGPIAAGPGALCRRLSGAPGDERPRALAAIGGGEACAAAAFDVLECVRAARDIAGAAGLDASGIPAPSSLAWADGEAAVAVRVGGEGFQVWGAWLPSRSDLAVPADDTVARR
ncbi:MAG: hypothetical protein ACYTKD_16905 [Planctomycetota bacterium]